MLVPVLTRAFTALTPPLLFHYLESQTNPIPPVIESILSMLRTASLRVQRVGQNKLRLDVLMHSMRYNLFSSSPVWLNPMLRASF